MEGYSCNVVLYDPKVVLKISNMLLCVNIKNLHIAFFCHTKVSPLWNIIKIRRHSYLYSFLEKCFGGHRPGGARRMARGFCIFFG